MLAALSCLWLGLAPAAEREELQLAFGGDVIFGRYVGSGYRPLVETNGKPFAAVATQLEADLTVANLETPVVSELPERSPIWRGHRFGADATAARMLADAGFFAVTIANNHMFDLGRDGVAQTPARLREVGVVPVGSTLEIVKVNGWRVALVGVATYANFRPPTGVEHQPLVRVRDLPKRLAPLIESANETADLLVVSVHWGVQGADDPQGAQKQAARALIDAGVDLVIGHHPHVWQGVERRGDGLIAYSLGNLLFFGGGDAGVRDTAILRVRFASSGCLRRAEVVPIRIEGTAHPRPEPATGREAAAIRRRIQRLSKRLGTSLTDTETGLVSTSAGC